MVIRRERRRRARSRPTAAGRGAPPPPGRPPRRPARPVRTSRASPLGAGAVSRRKSEPSNSIGDGGAATPGHYPPSLTRMARAFAPRARVFPSTGNDYLTHDQVANSHRRPASDTPPMHVIEPLEQLASQTGPSPYRSPIRRGPHACRGRAAGASSDLWGMRRKAPRSSGACSVVKVARSLTGNQEVCTAPPWTVRTKWLTRPRAPHGFGLPPRPHGHRAEPARRRARSLPRSLEAPTVPRILRRSTESGLPMERCRCRRAHRG